MLTEEEKSFLEYWEANRLKERKTFKQLLIGLPIGLLFALPILVNYFSGWNKRASMVGRAQFNPIFLIVAILSIAIFYAVFSRKHRWEMQEQRFLELRKKQDKFLPDSDTLA